MTNQNYFTACKTLDDLKATYRRLAKENHPDCGGDVAAMQEINRQYEIAFDRLSFGCSDGRKTGEKSSDFISVIDVLLSLHGIHVELCGSWLWISGDTLPVKDTLKRIGCKWHSKKKVWFWCPAGSYVRSFSNPSMTKIREKYGSQVLTSASDTVPACLVG